MDAHKTTLISLFSGDETRYIIPVYQRNYNWTTKQCKQLFNDLLTVMDKEKMHFFGSVVKVYNKNESYLVIDGQQRMTTVSLIWLAMLQLIKDGVRPDEEGEMTYRIERKVSYTRRQELFPKIVHVEKDRKAYMALLEGNKDHYVQDSNITRNFNTFYHWIKVSDRSLEDFEDAIKKLEVVNIELDDKDNPQLIFESLNSTGLALSDGDKIRNFILMDQKVSDQQRFYKDYWTDIEHNADYTGNEKDALNAVTYFVRDYLTMESGKIPSLNNVYYAFKDYAKDKGAEELLIKMKKFASYLSIIEKATSNCTALNAVLKRIALLETRVSHPFTFRIIDDYYSGKRSEQETIDIFEVMENFIIRRLICDVPSNALNKIFASLYGSATRLSEKADISLYDAVVYLLTSRSESGRFPDDDEFKMALAHKNIYKMAPKVKTYIFFRLNAGHSAEGDTSVIDKMQAEGDNMLTIEHVMPQTLSESWKQTLGGHEEAKRIQDKWENTIANLTLTAYNSSYSNSDFQTKLTLKDEKGYGIGFKDSPLHMNEYIKNQTTWGEPQLEERLAMIQEEATNVIWRYPEVIYTTDGPKNDELTLEDNPEDFTYSSFVDGKLNGTNIPLEPGTTWKLVVDKVVKMLDPEYHYDMVRIANDKQIACLQDETNKFENSVKILDGIYAYLNSSTFTKMRDLGQLFDHLGIDRDSLVFHVSHSDNGED